MHWLHLTDLVWCLLSGILSFTTATTWSRTRSLCTSAQSPTSPAYDRRPLNSRMASRGGGTAVDWPGLQTREAWNNRKVCHGKLSRNSKAAAADLLALSSKFTLRSRSRAWTRQRNLAGGRWGSIEPPEEPAFSEECSTVLTCCCGSPSCCQSSLTFWQDLLLFEFMLNVILQDIIWRLMMRHQKLSVSVRTW